LKIFDRIFSRSRVDVTNPRDPVLAEWFGGSGDDVGASITPESAMRVSAVYACVSLIAETLAALPLHVYRERKGETSKAYDHPLYAVLHDMALAGRMTAFEWRESMITHTALRGDSFSRIIQDGAGRITGLEMIHPARVELDQGKDGRPRYIIKKADGTQDAVLLDDEVLRLPFKMLDGVTSMSPIKTHRQTIGLADVSQKYLTRFFQNSAQPKGALKVPTSLSEEAVRRLREAWERRHQGAENAGRIAVFDGGMEWQSIGMSMEDAQYIELQHMSIEDIARIYGVPAHKIGDLRRATFSNIEHQAIAFYQDTILKWCRRIESRMNPYLLTPKERKQGYFIAFDMKGILRGDAAARGRLYQTLFYLGAMSPNEIRGAEDMNPYEGGDRYFVQGAAMPMDKIDETLAARGPQASEPKDDDEQAKPDGETPPSS